MKQDVGKQRKIAQVLYQSPLDTLDEKYRDLEYWLEQPVTARLGAVTFLVSQSLGKTPVMDKTVASKRRR